VPNLMGTGDILRWRVIDLAVLAVSCGILSCHRALEKHPQVYLAARVATDDTGAVLLLRVVGDRIIHATTHAVTVFDKNLQTQGSLPGGVPLPTHGRLTHVTADPNGHWIAALMRRQDGESFAYLATTWDAAQRFTIPNAVDVRFVPDKGTCVVLDNLGQLSAWDLGSMQRKETQFQRATVEGEVDDFFAIAVSPNGRAMAALGRGGAKANGLWDIDSGNLLSHIAAPETLWGGAVKLRDVAFTADSRTLLFLSQDMVIWALGIESSRLSRPIETDATALDYCAQGQDGLLAVPLPRSLSEYHLTAML